MSDLRAQFLEGMSRAAASVNVITTAGQAGRAGLTVSAMTSVSADGDRPMLLICVNHASAGAQAILDNGIFAVNVLSEDHSDISDVFAGRSDAQGEAKFGCARWQDGTTGAPLLDDALVAFDCRVSLHRQIGTHHVIFGEVEAVRLEGQGRPLIYAARNYAVPSDLIRPGRSN